MSDDALAIDARRELLENILPFWRKHSVDQPHGGFIGELSNDLRLRPAASKGLILNARILWTFSAAHRRFHDAQDEALARRAYSYLTHHFLDPEHGGYLWELTPDGEPLDGSKKIYGQAFCIYALSEFCQAFDEPGARQYAIDLFSLIETHAHDARNGGYVETLAPDWEPREDVRLSSADMNEKKSMNNHLHMLEAYASLLRVWPDRLLARRLRELIELFQTRILNSTGTHFNHFFDDLWRPKSDSYTFGHDIEGSWLLCEAADVLAETPIAASQASAATQPQGDRDAEPLLKPVRELAVKLARATLNEGLDKDGGLLYEARAGKIVNAGKEWWPQAEAVVGFYNAWQLTNDAAFRDGAERCWQFIQKRVVDHHHGEWYWRILPDGTPDPKEPKVSTWKCPYHNGRCCLEIIRRAEGRKN